MITRTDCLFRLQRQERPSQMPNRDAIVQPGLTLIFPLLLMTSTSNRRRIKTDRRASQIALNARTNDNLNLNKMKTNPPRVRKTRLLATAPVTVITSLRAPRAKRRPRFHPTPSRVPNVRRLLRVPGGCCAFFPVKAGISLAECSRLP